jgi:outer membrane lipoprotein-sorting protein
MEMLAVNRNSTETSFPQHSRRLISLSPSPLVSLPQWLFVLLLGTYVTAAPATQPTSAPAIDAALWQKMTDIDARGSKISSLVADFEQKKYTALLRKPLTSSGKVRVRGAIMRWDTEKPEPNVMLVGDKDVQLYYSAQKTVEVYTLDQRLAELAASPLPRLAVLKDRFSFAEIPAADMDKSADAGKVLALKLTPIQDELRQHVQEVRVLLDIAAGYIVQAELTDGDGDRTVIHFRNVVVNTDIGDLELKVPAGTKITRPLDGMQGVPAGRGN